MQGSIEDINDPVDSKRASTTTLAGGLTNQEHRRRFLLACVLIVLVCLGLTYYFCSCQDVFYTHYQPFYDSVGYYDQLHAVMLTGQQKGLAEAIYHAFDSGTTVFMPFLIGSLLSVIVEPSRNLAVWIQMFELCVLLLSALYYFTKIRSLNPLNALVLLAPFVLTTCLYRNNGGLSDFRMDLSLYLTYATACIWYLIAVSNRRKLHFGVLGLVIAISCLFRATAPVYYVLGLGPIVLWDVLREKNRVKLIQGLAIAFVIAAAGSLWFYVLHFDNLHYYYFVWNTDANAKLPLAQSIIHIEFAFRHIGNQVLVWYCCINLFVLMANRSPDRSNGDTFRKVISDSIPAFDMRLLWIAVAPLLMLVSRGAGLNQFVCFPAVAGILLFVLSPIAANQRFMNSRIAMISAAVVSVVCLGSVALEGWHNHRHYEYNSMKAHVETIETIVSDAQEQGLRHVNYGTTHVYYLNSSSLGSTIRFDIADSQIQGRRMFVDEIQMVKNGVFSGVVAEANWEELEGADTEEKLSRLLRLADTRVDYLIVPDDATVDFLQEKVAFNVINRYQRRLVDHVKQSDNWIPVGRTIVNRKNETVQLYRNSWKTRLAQGRLNDKEKAKYR